MPVHCLLTDVVSSRGGWLEILNLPPPLWTEDVFRFIGDLCGGFIETSNQSERGISLSVARIKTQPPPVGFIPASITLPIALIGTEWTVYPRSFSTGHSFTPPSEPSSSSPKIAAAKFPLPVMPTPNPLLPPPPPTGNPQRLPDQPQLLQQSPLIPTKPLINVDLITTDIKGKSPISAHAPSESFIPAPMILPPNPQLPINESPAALFPTKLPFTINNPINTPSPSFSLPSFSAITFPEGPTSLFGSTAHFTTTHLPSPDHTADTETYLSSPATDKEGPLTNFEARSLDLAIFGEDPTIAHQPLNTLPPIPDDLSTIMAKHTNSHPASPNPSHKQSQPSPSSLSLPDLASILGQHGLCIMAIPSLPPPKARKPAGTSHRRNKLHRELHNLHSSINYDKAATLLISEGDEGDK